jgi:hypothetical protein
MVFFEKKEPKNFCAALAASSPRRARGKSFCFFFQKEALAFLSFPAAPRTNARNANSPRNTM